MMKTWYPERIPYAEHKLQVSDLHTLYVEECGNPDGVPVIWCHGGPGGGFGGTQGRQFDPNHYRLIMFDQRGAGKSTPFASRQDNTTHDLIQDMEKIREFLGIDNWIVGGRSWGTTLALLYAEAHPDRVNALYLAAVFLCEKKGSDWIFQSGAGRVYPEAWKPFESLVPPERRHDMFGAYMDMMFGDDEILAQKAALAWSTWEANTVSVRPDPAVIDLFTSPEVMLALARLECHYLSQGGFIDEGQIIRDAYKIAHIPTKIIHGRYDMNCLYEDAWRLHNSLPCSKLFTVDVGGHTTNEPDTVHMQVVAADELRSIKKKCPEPGFPGLNIC